MSLAARTFTKILLVAAATLLCSTSMVEAKKRIAPAPSLVDSPRYAGMVVDAESGKLLYARNADAPRFPASVTKVMTLYMAFEALEAKKLRLDEKLPVSKHAASMSPSKLGLRPGSTIVAKDAMMALITKSANDAAAVLGERLGNGSEAEFARRMTAKAKQLGMTKTVYKNASGLPNTAQVTTARDQVKLGLAIQRHFPKYYAWFNTSAYKYGRTMLRNHNNLVGRYMGADGIKTGYINASGFNLLASAKRNNVRLVAAVFGGATAASRDAHMMKILDNGFAIMADAGKNAPVQVAQKLTIPSKPSTQGATGPSFSETIGSSPSDALSESEKLAQQYANMVTQSAQQDLVPEQDIAAQQLNAKIALLQQQPSPSPYSTQNSSLVLSQGIPANRTTPSTSPQELARQNQNGGRQTFVFNAGAQPLGATRGTSKSPTQKLVAKETPPRNAGWAIQVGSFTKVSDAKAEAKRLVSRQPNLVAANQAIVVKSGTSRNVLYRTRFVGFDRQTAEKTCASLKRAKFACVPVQHDKSMKVAALAAR